MAKNRTRKRKQTSRYGDLATNMNSTSEMDENYADNSMDDPNYDPSQNKRQKIVADDLLSDDSFAFLEENFDDEFDGIESLHVNSESLVAIDNSTRSNHSPSLEGRAPPKDHSESSLVATDNSTRSNNSSSHENSVHPKDHSESSLDAKYFRKMLMILHENSLQTLTRIAVIEDSLLKSGNLVTTKMFETKAFSKYYEFSKSNGLPIKTIDEIKKFENHLSDEEFEEKAVTSFADFPGIKSMRGNKPKLLKTVLHEFVAKPLFAMFTWTGKAGRGQARKNALKDYPKFLRLLHTILENIEGTYDKEMFLDHLKNKVIKQAYVHAPKAINSNLISNGDHISGNEILASTSTVNVTVLSSSNNSLLENSFLHEEEFCDEILTTKQQSTFDYETTVRRTEHSNGQFSKSKPTLQYKSTKLQSALDNETTVRRTGHSNGQFSKSKPTLQYKNTKPQAALDNETTVRRTGHSKDQFSESRPTLQYKSTKLQSALDNETTVRQTGHSNGQFSKSKSTHQYKSAKSQSTLDSETTVQRMRLPNAQFPENKQNVNVQSNESNYYEKSLPSEHASVPKSKTNNMTQPPESPESVLYGSAFESHNIPQLPLQSKTNKPVVRNSKPNIWPDSWNLLMSSAAPKPIRNPNNSDKILNIENSRGKYLFSLAQNYKDL